MELIERIDAALKRLTDGHAPMRIPASQTDVDLVLADAKREIARLNQERNEWAEKEPTAWMGEIEAYADHRAEVLVVRSKSEVSPCVPRDKIRWTPLFAGMPANLS